MKINNAPPRSTAPSSYRRLSDLKSEFSYKQPVDRARTPRTDTVDIHSAPSADKAIDQTFEALLEQLQSDYPQVQFMVMSDGASDRDVLADAASKMGDGYLVVLSQEFMNSLHAGGDSFQRKTQALLNIVKGLSAYAPGTMVIFGKDTAAYAAKKAEKEAPPFSIPSQDSSNPGCYAQMLPSPSEQEFRKASLVSSNHFQVAGIYSRLAHAKSKTDVQTVMQDARRSISALKMASVYGDDKERLRAKKALKSLQKLLLRGQTKINSFNREHLTELRRKRAQKEQRREKEMQARAELKKARLSRSIRDGAIRKEGQLESLTIPGAYRHVSREKLRELYGLPAIDSGAAMPPADFSVPSIGAVSFEGLSLPADMQITQVVSLV